MLDLHTSLLRRLANIFSSFGYDFRFHRGFHKDGDIKNIGGTTKAAITCPNVSWTTSVYHKEAAQRVRKKSIQKDRRLKLNFFIVETPIPKAKRSGIGKLNNPAQRRVMRLNLQE
jgi:hypothetical protein